MQLKDFGNNLAKIRIAKNMSAYELSLRIGKAPNYIHLVENGKVNISIMSLYAICEQLEIKPARLLEF